MSEDLEESNELAMELATESSGDKNKEPWVNHAAFSSMIVAMIMTVGALLSGISANESMIERQNEIVTQTKFSLAIIQRDILQNRLEMKQAEGIKQVEDLDRQILEFEQMSEEYLQETAEDLVESAATLRVHELLALGVTIMSISVTMTGMAIVLRARLIWYASIGFAALGFGFVIHGIYSFFI